MRFQCFKICCWVGMAIIVMQDYARGQIIQISGFDQFLSPATHSNDFEGGFVDTPFIDFDFRARITAASVASSGVTSSGRFGLLRPSANNPLTAIFAVPAREVGMVFGNDDFRRRFDVLLTVYDVGNTRIGSVSVQSNGNDFADQFIGLRSDIPFAKAEVVYSRSASSALSIFVDDFTIGVPEPTTFVLLVSSLPFLTRRRLCCGQIRSVT